MKLISILLILSVLPITIIGFLAYNISNNVLYDTFKMTSMQNVVQIKDSIGYSFEKYESTLNLLSSKDMYKDVYSEEELEIEVLNDLGQVQGNDPSILSMYLGLENKLMLIYPEGGLPDGFDPTTRGWYIDAKANEDEIIYSDPYIDASTGKNVITVSKTVKENGKVIGAIGIDMHLKI